MNRDLFSRRDWLRMKPQNQTVVPAYSESTPDHHPLAAEGLQQLPLPPNHDGMDMNSLPPVCEALLDATQVTELGRDIREQGESVALVHRSGPRSRGEGGAKATPSQVQAAFDALLGGSVLRLQIRYSWNGARWIDTLERRDGNFRLVRVSHPVQPEQK